MTYASSVIDWAERSFDGQPEFIQAIVETVKSLEPELQRSDLWQQERVLERIIVPERNLCFRVVWEDDNGNVNVNRGYRVVFSTALGPGKGGLRFHPTVNSSILHFLGFEQAFKNALTGLHLGAAKGGSDFDPHGRSDREIMRFCQAFMTELQRHIGAQVDVPAGDIGVGGREIGYLHGQYRRITARWEGELTGKSPVWGGSLIRSEATGYGLVYFVEEMLKTRGEGVTGTNVAISGAGNVAQFAARLLLQRGAKVLTLSDSTGTLYMEDGFRPEDVDSIEKLRSGRGGSLGKWAEANRGTFLAGKRPWSVPCDIALPCATQNEVERGDAQALVSNGCKLVAEGANMPSNPAAIETFMEAGIAFGPAKAANAGGVAVSGLEMAQNSVFRRWTADRVDSELQEIMQTIHANCRAVAEEFGQPHNLEMGANIAGFRRLARAVVDQGLG